jgi:hypothetical protein
MPQQETFHSVPKLIKECLGGEARSAIASGPNLEGSIERGSQENPPSLSIFYELPWRFSFCFSQTMLEVVE